MDDDRPLPSWARDYVPHELIESDLLKLVVTLQVVEKRRCGHCGTEYKDNRSKCNAIVDGELCGSQKFVDVRKKIVVDLLSDLDLDMDNLEKQMEDLPSIYAFWNAVYSELRAKVALQERKLKATKGRLTEIIQKDAMEANIKFTGDQVKSVIEASDETRRADVELIKANMICGKLYGMLEALRMKAELSRSLAGFKRQEMSQS